MYPTTLYLITVACRVSKERVIIKRTRKTIYLSGKKSSKLFALLQISRHIPDGLKNKVLKMKSYNSRRNLDNPIILVFEKPFLKITPKTEVAK